MKSRSLIYALVFVVPVLVLLWIVVGSDPVEKMEKTILLGKQDEPDRIEIANTYDTVRLECMEGRWYLEDGEAASVLAVENLIWAARNLRVDGLQEDRESGLKGAVRVTYSSRDKEVLSYELMPFPGGLQIRHERSGDLYRVSLPGYGKLDLGKVFSASVNHYREHMLIDLLPSDICSVELERRGMDSYRFTMDSSGSLGCILPESGRSIDMENLDELSIRLLFSYFTAIRYEYMLSEEEALRTPQEERWLATLRVEAFHGEEHELRIFSMDDGRDGNHMFLALVIHNGEARPLVVKYLYLDVLMRDLSRFFKGSA